MSWEDKLRWRSGVALSMVNLHPVLMIRQLMFGSPQFWHNTVEREREREDIHFNSCLRIEYYWKVIRVIEEEKECKKWHKRKRESKRAPLHGSFHWRKRPSSVQLSDGVSRRGQREFLQRPTEPLKEYEGWFSFLCFACFFSFRTNIHKSQINCL